MVTYPANYNPDATYVKIIVQDLDGNTVYTYESPQVKSIFPIGGWKLRGNKKSSIRNSHGVISGTEQYQTGFLFNGSNYIIAPYTELDRTQNQPFSVRFKIKTTSNTNSDQIVSNGRISFGNGWSLWRWNTNSTLTFTFINGGVNYSQDFTGYTINDGNEHEVIVTYDGSGNRSGVKLFVDNVDRGTGASQAISTITGAGYYFSIGASSNGFNLLDNGEIYDVFFYDVNLSASQVSELYTYQNPLGIVSTTNTEVQDVILEQFALRLGINDDHGSFICSINDDSDQLTDTSNRKNTIIQNKYRVQVFLGKDAPTLRRWFWGIIDKSGVTQMRNNLQNIHLKATGYGIRLVNRKTSIRRNQKKQSDGVTLDDTDTTVKISELVKDIIEDTDHLAWKELGLEDDISTNLVEDIDIKMPDFTENMQSFAHAISRLSAKAGAYFGVDADRNLFLRMPNTLDSLILITNDVNSSLFSNWDGWRVGIMKDKNPFEIEDSTESSGYSVLHGYGAQVDTMDIDQSSESAQSNLSSIYVASAFVPKSNNIQKIGLKIKRVGTITEPLVISVIGNTSGAPNVNDLRKKIIIGVEELNKVSTVSSEWKYFSWDKFPVTVGETLFLVVNKHGNGSNHMEWSYNAGGNYYDSTNGTAWTLRTGLGTHTMRIYPTRGINHLLINTETLRKFGLNEKEIIFKTNPNDFTTRQTLVGLSDVLGREKREYSPLVINPTSEVIPLGKVARIKTVRGLDVYADVIGIEMSMNSRQSLGIESFTLYLQEWK